MNSCSIKAHNRRQEFPTLNNKSVQKHFGGLCPLSLQLKYYM